jgi:hypothetical protein
MICKLLILFLKIYFKVLIFFKGLSYFEVKNKQITYAATFMSRYTLSNNDTFTIFFYNVYKYDGEDRCGIVAEVKISGALSKSLSSINDRKYLFLLPCKRFIDFDNKEKMEDLYNYLNKLLSNYAEKLYIRWHYYK